MFLQEKAVVRRRLYKEREREGKKKVLGVVIEERSGEEGKEKEGIQMKEDKRGEGWQGG